MTYATYEGSRHSGQPVELYRFTVGFGDQLDDFWDGLVDATIPAMPEAPGALVRDVDIHLAPCAGGDLKGWGIVRDLSQTSTTNGHDALGIGICGDCGNAAGVASATCITSPRSAIAYSLFRDGNGFSVWGAYDGGIGGGGAYFYAQRDLSEYLEPNHAYVIRFLAFRLAGQVVDSVGVRIQDASVTVDQCINQGGCFPAGGAWQWIDLTHTTGAGGEIVANVGHFSMEIGAAAIVGLGRLLIYDAEAPAEEEESDELHYTSADTAITFNGDTYQPAIFTRTAFTSGDSEGGDIELTMPRDHAIAQLFYHGFPAAPVSLDIFRVHRPDVAAGNTYATAFKGKVTRARYAGPSCILTVSGGQSWLSRKLPRVLVQPQCNWMLYDGRCQLNKESFRFDSTVTAVDGFTLTISGLEADGGDYNHGFLVLASGEALFIESQAGDAVTLLTQPLSVAVNDTVAVYEGCDRSPARCQALGNLVHFGGDALLPQKNPFGPTGFNVD